MKLGLSLAQDGFDYKEIKKITLEAERVGVDSVWLLDHLNASPRPDEQQFLECWTLLSALSVETTSVRLGSLVLNVNNRNPALLSKMVATLDMISSGRLDFGIGAGGTNRAEQQKKLGYEYEFDAYGIPFPTTPSIRIEKLDEGLEIMKRMWTQHSATFTGEHYSIKDAFCLPKPVQKPYPPIWIGSRFGSKMMRVVAKHADGWNMNRVTTVEDFQKGRTLLKEFCSRIGRNADEIKTSVVITGSMTECEQRLKEFADKGLDLAILRIPRGKEIEYLREIKHTLRETIF